MKNSNLKKKNIYPFVSSFHDYFNLGFFDPFFIIIIVVVIEIKAADTVSLFSLVDCRTVTLLNRIKKKQRKKREKISVCVCTDKKRERK